jgi:hypothetical protein
MRLIHINNVRFKVKFGNPLSGISTVRFVSGATLRQCPISAIWKQVSKQNYYGPLSGKLLKESKGSCVPIPEGGEESNDSGLSNI